MTAHVSIVDFEGRPCRYADLLEHAPPDAAARIEPRTLRQRHANMQAAIARMRDDVASAKLDALIVIGDDQEEMFDHSNMPAIGVYYGDNDRQRAGPKRRPRRWTGRACAIWRRTATSIIRVTAGLARHLIDVSAT